MKQNHKKIRRIFWIILIAGSLLIGILTSLLEVSNFTKQLVLCAWLTVLVVSSIIIDLRWGKKLSCAINALSPLLYEEPDQYILKIHELLDNMRSPMLRQLLVINHAAALCVKKEYSPAKEMLLSLPVKRLSHPLRPYYWANLSLIHFYLGEEDQGCSILEQQRKMFSIWTEDSRLGPTLAILRIFELLAKHQPEEAQEALKQLRPRWEDEHNAEDFELLQQRCQSSVQELPQ